jgi:RsmE family RNA methyltransferase
LNIILFEQEETERPLSLSDLRGRHIHDILKLKTGDEFKAGIINGPRGRARIVKAGPEGYALEFELSEPPPPPFPLILAVGAGRPPSIKKILKEGAAIGFAEIHFFPPGRGEAAYLEGHIFKNREFRSFILEGASQSGCTTLPLVAAHASFAGAFDALNQFSLNEKGWTPLALDNRDAETGLADYLGVFSGSAAQGSGPGPKGFVLWAGAERGFSEEEREVFAQAGTPRLSLGPRILRVETACIAAGSLCLAALGLWGPARPA